ncbi:hypothetical protein E4U42_002312 [Claviceps africana]|uniref:Isopenicillin N synthase-like Fe(2+) 2OG dioxygenase domain-containing protein n=1 Tax=Claviceps africana TaxID=83212 RepID=A0A8K0J8H8_9HYPO|nr:hypothetical protein E4U42_002312 [Claviceps africana]
MYAFLDCKPLRMGAHYDLSIITLVHQTACDNGFCEVCGRFVDLPTRPDTVVVFCGAVGTLVRRRQHQGAQAPRQSPLPRPDARQQPHVERLLLAPQADESGFDVRIPSETATFGDWLGGNYVNMRQDADAADAPVPAPVPAAAYGNQCTAKQQCC